MWYNELCGEFAKRNLVAIWCTAYKIVLKDLQVVKLNADTLYQALSEEAKKRTSLDNVQDVVTALSLLMCEALNKPEINNAVSLGASLAADLQHEVGM